MMRQRSLYMFLCCLFFCSCFSVSKPAPRVDKASYLEVVGKGVSYLRKYDHQYWSGSIRDSNLLRQAEAMFFLAKNLRPEDPEAIDGLGSVQVRLGAMEIARTLFLNCLDKDPSYSRAYVHLAYIEERAGNLLVSRELLTRALELSPVDSHALNDLGGILYDSRSSEEEKAEGRRLLFQATEIGDSSNPVIKHNKYVLQKE